MSRRGRGEGSVYQRKDGRWVGVVEVGFVGGRRIRRTVTAKTRAEVQRRRNELERQVAGGVLEEALTVEMWLTHWLDDIAARRVKPRTLEGYRGYVRRYLTPLLGPRRVSDLKPEHVRAAYDAMAAQGLSGATIRQAHAILRRALEVAVREGRAVRNVAALVDAPSVGSVTHEHLTTGEARAVLAAATDARTGARLAVALLLGLRQGEALALRWRDVDLEGGVVHVRRTVGRVSGEWVEGPPKSAAGLRDVPMPPVVAQMLALWRAEQQGKLADLVFPRAGGDLRQWEDSRTDWGKWRAALDAAGVRLVPLHGARATCATLLEELGATPRQVADILGHSTVQVAQRHYVHSSPEALRAGLERVAGALTSPSGG